MKRTAFIIIAIYLMCSITFANASDLSSFSDKKLEITYDRIRNELTARKLLVEENTEILDQAGVRIFISGAPTLEESSLYGELEILIPVIIINDTDFSINLSIENVSVNGWSTDGFISDSALMGIPKGKKAKGYIELYYAEKCEIEKIEDFSDAEFRIRVYNSEDWFGDDIIPKSDIITIFASQKNND